jgi:hypothetical protein
VIAALIGLAIGFGIRQAEIDLSELDPGSDEEATADTGAGEGGTEGAADVPPPLDQACPEAEPDETPRARPTQPAPVPDQPGQHALVFVKDDPAGNLDLAPGGGYETGHSPASDAKTVFVVCADSGPSEPTGEMCDYVADEDGAETRSALHVRTVVMVVYEARTGAEVGRSAAIPVIDDPFCPPVVFGVDAVVEMGELTNQMVVDWTRQHLTGARYTP